METTQPDSRAASEVQRLPAQARAESQRLAARARSEFASGAHASAAATARQALALDAGNADANVVLGMGLESSDPAGALDAWQRAVAIAPNNPEAHFRIGNFQRRQGSSVAAVSAYRAAQAAGLQHPVLLNNLGLALQDDGELKDEDEALRCYRAALALQPGMIEALVNIADLHSRRMQFSEALPFYEKAVSINGAVAALWQNLGLACYRLGAQAKARAALERAAELDPHNVTTLTTLAATFLAEQRDADALPYLERALTLDPDGFEAQSMLLYANQRTCDWRGFDELFARQRARLLAPDAPPVVPHNLLALPYSPAQLKSVAQNWVRKRIAPNPRARPARPPLHEGRLRIGYLGSDFRSHALANLLSKVLELHDRSRFEVFGYSFGPDDKSPARARFERAFDRFVDVRDESIERTAQRIRSDRIGILFDTGGYVLNARSEIFAMRPAPLQINCIGFPGTLGAEYYDYIIGDDFVTPPEQQENFSERLMLMPHCYMPGDTDRVIAAAPARDACGLPDAGLVYCCFNATWKIHPRIFDVWMRVLAGTPGSVLWLLDSNAASRHNLRSEAQLRGVAPERLVFAPMVPLAEHLGRHALADLFLDTFPCNAHTTTNDALFAGLPVLTCAGATFASRVSGSHLRAIGLPELVTGDLAAYQALALELGRDPDRLADVRARLSARRAAAPLFDMPAYTRALEERLLAAWEALAS